MNIEPLYELKDRLEASAVAGVSLIADDFRLTRAIEHMEPLSKASPVFAKICESAKAVSKAAEEERAAALLDVLALVEAVLATQAAVGVEGELEPVEIYDIGYTYSQIPYSQIAPVYEALTTSGSGHYATVMEARRNTPELFKDYRLRDAVIKGLGAAYAELAENIEEWLSNEDESIIPLIKRNLDPKGKKEMVRRIHVIENIAGKKENAYYISLLDEAEKDVREAVIDALYHDTSNIDLLIELSKTEKGKAKKAAIRALAKMEDSNKKIEEFFRKMMKKNINSVIENFYISTSDMAGELVAEAIKNLLDKLEKQIADDNLYIKLTDVNDMSSLFKAMLGKSSKGIIEVYKRMMETAAFPEKGESSGVLIYKETRKDPNGNKPAEKMEDAVVGTLDKSKVIKFNIEHLIDMLTDSVIINPNKKLCEFIGEIYNESLSNKNTAALMFRPMLVKEFITRPAKEVYDKFGELIKADKDNKLQIVRRSEAAEVFFMIKWSNEVDSYAFNMSVYDASEEKRIYIKRKLFEKFDIRWFKLLTDGTISKSVSNISRYNGLVQYHNYTYLGQWTDVLDQLIIPEDKEVCAIISEHIYKFLQQKNKYATHYFQILNRCGFKDGRGLVLINLKGANPSRYHLYDLLANAPMSLDDKLAELEDIKKLIEDKKLTVQGGLSEEQYNDLKDDVIRYDINHTV